jgi:hypothetical protein
MKLPGDEEPNFIQRVYNFVYALFKREYKED